MHAKKVKDLMVPLEEYATVSEEANLHEAVLALEKAQSRFRQDRYKHRAVLVYDKEKRIVGKLSQLDVIKGLESGQWMRCVFFASVAKMMFVTAS